jgi:hypothetical protein
MYMPTQELPLHLPRFVEAFQIHLDSEDGQQRYLTSRWERAATMTEPVRQFWARLATLGRIGFVATTTDADYAGLPRSSDAMEIVWEWRDARWVSTSSAEQTARYCRWRGVPIELLGWPDTTGGI